jgi:hypothetical protein
MRCGMAARSPARVLPATGAVSSVPPWNVAASAGMAAEVSGRVGGTGGVFCGTTGREQPQVLVRQLSGEDVDVAPGDVVPVAGA